MPKVNERKMEKGVFWLTSFNAMRSLLGRAKNLHVEDWGKQLAPNLQASYSGSCIYKMHMDGESLMSHSGLSSSAPSLVSL